MRVGQGFDVHKFGGKNPLIIGTITIPYAQSVLAHSDGDVLLHAIIDALLGAAALGDIGQLFPDSNPLLKDIDSSILLHKTYNYVSNKGYHLANIDTTIIAQVPKITPYIPQMRDNLANLLQCHKDNISIKATTTEKLGFIGREEGIACKAIALLKAS
ncbi:2-C-methyl-D-erythritol 2,4-cyclodiphosphate synthase [Candidatus Fukatsuia anoeciicola]|uniref:2-C-methyl-D-erythritol 2,4-cyclodiphosphate synthase n=1 Tax=Candidatus Fukatsuia anoeciicola TaxID=2994492 RepID=UPI0034638DFB